MLETLPGKTESSRYSLKGHHPAELASCKLWRHGPDWLVDFKREFEEDNMQMPEECLKEMKVSYCNLTHNSSTTNELSNLGKVITPVKILVNYRDYSKSPHMSSDLWSS